MTDIGEPDPTESAALAEARRRLWSEMPADHFNLWRHAAVTAAYLQYIEDQISYYRASAADFVEQGVLASQAAHPDLSLDSLRGQILMLRNLHSLKLDDIQRFYGVAQPEDRHEAQGEQED